MDLRFSGVFSTCIFESSTYWRGGDTSELCVILAALWGFCLGDWGLRGVEDEDEDVMYTPFYFLCR
jgi:hypothetical protein